MSKNGAKIGLKQGLWCKQVESKTVKYWQLGTLLPTLFSVHENKGIIFFFKENQAFFNRFIFYAFKSWTYMQIHTPTMVRGRGGGG